MYIHLIITVIINDIYYFNYLDHKVHTNSNCASQLLYYKLMLVSWSDFPLTMKAHSITCFPLV